MKIWLLKLGEPLPTDDLARLHRVGILASMLSELGHEVTWWTGAFDHHQKRHRFGKDYTLQIGVNYRIKLLYAPGYAKNASIPRIRHDYLVAKQFAEVSKAESAPDIILTSYPTPELAEAAVKYAYKNNIPVLVDIRDLWPDALENLAPSGMHWLVRLASRPINRRNSRVFHQATGIIAISKDYLEWGLKYANRRPRDSDGVFYLGYPKQTVSSAQRKDARQRWLAAGINADSFVCCYFGTIGRHFNFRPIIAAARELQWGGDHRFRFVICGVGSDLDYYKDRARGINSLVFPGWINYAEIVSLMELSAVGLAPYSTTARMSLPNKPFEYFSHGLPVLSSLRGELEVILAEGDCGITYSNEDTLLRALKTLADQPGVCSRMGQNARQLFEREFSAEVVYPKMINHLEQLAKKDQQR